MPTFQFEAMDQTGQEFKDVIEAPSQEEAQATIRQMGYFVTKITVKKGRKTAAEKKAIKKKGKTFAIGGVKMKALTTFTRQLVHSSGRRLAHPSEPEDPGAAVQARGAEELPDRRLRRDRERGPRSPRRWRKSPKAFNRLYVNMIKAGEAGGALEVILKRLAEFQERDQALRRKVKGALVYPIAVVTFAVGILVFIMLKIVPQFVKIFEDFKTQLPAMTETADQHFQVGGPLVVPHSRPFR